MHDGRHLENLNSPQKEAVLHHLGPILVLAGAGTGKTRILTRRIANLILEHKVRPSSILAVTFTNKAAGEMKERLKLLIGDIAQRVWVSTFHSFGLRVLRRHSDLLGIKTDFVVYDSTDTKDLLKKILKEKNIDDKKYPPSIFASYIDQQKNIPIFPENISVQKGMLLDTLKLEVYDAYTTTLRSAGALDFGDLLSLTYRLFIEFPNTLRAYQDQFEFLLVDEFQDTNKVQYDIIKMISGERKNLLVVGDDDQSIYAFRGATIQNILNFESDFTDTKVVKLEQNYRSTSNILEGAHAVISKNKGRKEKHVWTSQDPGDKIFLFAGTTETEEAQYIATEIRRKIDIGLSFQDIAVFYRTNAQSRALEEALISYKIPYRIFGGLKFYDRKEVKDIIAYLRLIAHPNDNQAFLRVINTPTRGIGAQSILQIADLAKKMECSLFEASITFANKNKAVAGFVSLIQKLQVSYVNTSLLELMQDVIEKTEYGPKLKAIKHDPQAESRLENLQELVAIAAGLELSVEGADPLSQFLDRVALTGGDDTPVEGEAISKLDPQNSVSLMSLHLAKGLEFDLVFFTGYEEGLVPHHRTLYQPDEIEEERRLCYVGMTRARHTLHITRVKKRGMFSAGGDTTTSRFREASRFSFDIPKGVIDDPLGSFFTSSEEDYSNSNDDLDTTYDYEDEKPTGWVSTTSNKVRTKVKSNDIFGSGIVKYANQLKAPVINCDHLPPLSLSELIEGTTVTHPSFGKGTISGIDGDPKDKDLNVKVLVRFETTNQTKKLLFKYAGLRVGA